MVALNITTLSGTQLELAAELQSDVRSVKVALFGLVGLCFCRQHLMLGEALLSDSDKFEAHISDEKRPVELTLLRQSVDADLGAKQLRTDGFCATCVREAGFDARQLRAAGFDAQQLREANFDAWRLRGAGFDAMQLREAGFDARQLRDANFDALRLRGAGFDARQLREGGFDARELQETGFDAQQLREAGFHRFCIPATASVARPSAEAKPVKIPARPSLSHAQARKPSTNKRERRASLSKRLPKTSLVFKEGGQDYGQVQRMLGNGRCEVLCCDGTKRLCHIRGKMRKKVWVNQGDIVTVSLRDFQDHKGDIIHKCEADEVRNLQTYGEIPFSMKLNAMGGDTDGDSDSDFVEFGNPSDRDLFYLI